MTIRNEVTKAATGALLDVLETQPWYRRFAGTITTAAGGIATLGTWVLTTEMELPRTAQVALGLVVMVASVIAARATRNGTTPRGSQVLLDGVVEKVTDAVAGAESLDRLVRDQGEAAATAAREAAVRAAQDAIANTVNTVDRTLDTAPIPTQVRDVIRHGQHSLDATQAQVRKNLGWRG